MRAAPPEPGRAFSKGGLVAAREAVGLIVGRDTSVLDEQGVARAAVETVAENASDGVIAPLFYLMIGGAPLGMAYKAVNTLDSMVGYKNERYIATGVAMRAPTRRRPSQRVRARSGCAWQDPRCISASSLRNRR